MKRIPIFCLYAFVLALFLWLTQAVSADCRGTATATESNTECRQSCALNGFTKTAKWAIVWRDGFDGCGHMLRSGMWICREP